MVPSGPHKWSTIIKMQRALVDRNHHMAWLNFRIMQALVHVWKIILPATSQAAAKAKMTFKQLIFALAMSVCVPLCASMESSLFALIAEVHLPPQLLNVSS